LGWTTWSYGPSQHSATGGREFVTVDITNSGTRTGREVVQVYLRPDHEPVRLVGWAGVDAVAPGETRTVKVPLDSRAMRVWDDAAPGWRPINGGELLVCRGLGDLRSQASRHGAMRRG
jgi:beta-glucosidase